MLPIVKLTFLAGEESKLWASLLQVIFPGPVNSSVKLLGELKKVILLCSNEGLHQVNDHATL